MSKVLGPYRGQHILNLIAFCAGSYEGKGTAGCRDEVGVNERAKRKKKKKKKRLDRQIVAKLLP